MCLHRQGLKVKKVSSTKVKHMPESGSWLDKVTYLMFFPKCNSNYKKAVLR